MASLDWWSARSQPQVGGAGPPLSMTCEMRANWRAGCSTRHHREVPWHTKAQLAKSARAAENSRSAGAIPARTARRGSGTSPGSGGLDVILLTAGSGPLLIGSVAWLSGRLP